ncbi:hypothetical protein C4K24_3125 [Pseudomonas chlororaphis subsp. aurantiaca]|uniref:hypothetical protein n=1 Tax=Pseudomonas chlororaphis TaxID=587753 RepID=UPI000F6CFD84|nr:hypothetical protein [Pseudomonas chlororaphis]AZD22428.1 hypothetical protein C4K24_3125 [Pseudomonas chlororaphis subsp. aurantiaca]
MQASTGLPPHIRHWRVDPAHVARQCSEHIQRMLGYSIHAPFMGMVNGMHPKRMLEEPQGR